MGIIQLEKSTRTDEKSMRKVKKKLTDEKLMQKVKKES